MARKKTKEKEQGRTIGDGIADGLRFLSFAIIFVSLLSFLNNQINPNCPFSEEPPTVETSECSYSINFVDLCVELGYTNKTFPLDTNTLSDKDFTCIDEDNFLTELYWTETTDDGFVIVNNRSFKMEGCNGWNRKIRKNGFND